MSVDEGNYGATVQQCYHHSSIGGVDDALDVHSPDWSIEVMSQSNVAMF